MLLNTIVKNKKIISIITCGLIALSATNSNIYAVEDNLKAKESIDNNEDSSQEDSSSSEEDSSDKDDSTDDENQDNNINEVITITLDKLKDVEYIGKKVKVSAVIQNIESNKLSIKDNSGEGVLYLNNIDLSSISISDTVIATGLVEFIDGATYIVVSSPSDLEIIKNSDTEEDDKKDEVENDNSNNESNKPGTGSTQKPGISSGVQTPNNNFASSNNTSSQVSSIKQIYVRTVKTINTDLTSSQWSKIKSAIEEGLIKVVDLPENKIRIKQVSNGYGDRVWIVNDPRGLDEEIEEITRTIGLDKINELSYKDYDVTETRWNNILEDIEDGLGGHSQSEKFICSKYAHVEELSLETTIKIYGEAITQNIKVIILGDMQKIDKIKIDNIKYKVISQRKIKNKTSFFLEVDND